MTRYSPRLNGHLKLFENHTGQLADHRDQEQIIAITEEIKSRLNINNIDRLADYLRLADDDAMAVDQKLSLAISGWLLGSGAGIENLPEALSLVEVRAAVREYLRSESDIEREEILRRLTQLEGSSPANVAKIIATMKPPIETDFPQEGVPGLLELSFPGIVDEPEFRYYVQLPPEYDPSRRYPCIVTLHGGGSQPLGQIDWWAGTSDPRQPQRRGQATRHGYIVIAPAWAKSNQTSTNTRSANMPWCWGRCGTPVAGSASTRTGCFSAGTRWAVMRPGISVWPIPISGPACFRWWRQPTSMSSRYWKNAKTVPMYFVAGQMDGNKIARQCHGPGSLSRAKPDTMRCTSSTKGGGTSIFTTRSCGCSTG